MFSGLIHSLLRCRSSVYRRLISCTCNIRRRAHYRFRSLAGRSSNVRRYCCVAREIVVCSSRYRRYVVGKVEKAHYHEHREHEEEY